MDPLRLKNRVLEADIDFLSRHSKSAIELYANGERDLVQTLAELEDNQKLGLSRSMVRAILTDAMNNSSCGKNEKRRERLIALKARLIVI